MTTPTADATVYSDLKGLSALKRDAHVSDPNALRQVAKQFESIFAKMMLTSMRKANFGDPIFGSDQTEFYQGMFDDQLSLELTKGKGLGLADMLVRQLQKVAGAVDPTAADSKSKTGDVNPASAGSKGSAGLALPAGAKSTHEFALGKAADASAALKMPASRSAEFPYASAAAAAIAAGASGTAGTSRASRGAGGTHGLGMPDSSEDASGAASLGEVSAVSGEPDAVKAGALLNDANRFIQKMLDGNAQANETQANGGEPAAFHTPASPEDFVQQLWPCAEAAGKALGIDPKNILAQAALETGWGKSLPCDANGNPSFNFFGMKASGDWTGGSVSQKTLEFDGGIPVQKQARFRAYDSAQDSFNDYVALIRDNPRYSAALNTGSNTHAFANALQSGGYATDPAYAKKIAAIAQNLPNSATALKSSAAQPIP
jgi:flagellar protein FlgJ